MGKIEKTKKTESLEEKISEYDYDREIFDTIDYWAAKIGKIEGKITRLRNAYVQKEFDKGYPENNLHYYRDDKKIGYTVTKKGQIGYLNRWRTHDNND